MEHRHDFAGLVTVLSQGIGKRKLYFDGHDGVRDSAAEFATSFSRLTAERERDHLFVGLVEGKLVHDGEFLVGSTILGRQLVDFLQSIGSGGVLFRAPLECDEILALFGLAAEVAGERWALHDARRVLRARGVRSIELSPLYEDPAWFGQFLFDGQETAEHVEAESGTMIPVFQGMFDAVQQAHAMAGRDRQIDVAKVRSASEGLVRKSDDGFADILHLVRYPDYDTFTVGHSVRVALLTVLVAHRMGFPKDALIELGTAGLLHDVGKSRIPDSILFKPDRLTAEEWRLVEQHPVFGAEILTEHREVSPLAIGAAWGHHLRHDGAGGYPPTPSWVARSRITALLKVCDVFEALTAVRPYKTAVPTQRAYEIMLQDRHAFDPGAFTALVSAMGLYPPGHRVELTNGERGIVVAASVDIERPLVRVTHGVGGFLLASDARPLRNLSLPSLQHLGVARVLSDDATGSGPGATDDDPEVRDVAASGPARGGSDAGDGHLAHGPCR